MVVCFFVGSDHHHHRASLLRRRKVFLNLRFWCFPFFLLHLVPGYDLIVSQFASYSDSIRSKVIVAVGATNGASHISGAAPAMRMILVRQVCFSFAGGAVRSCSDGSDDDVSGNGRAATCECILVENEKPNYEVVMSLSIVVEL
jgi:hypothetical protein